MIEKVIEEIVAVTSTGQQAKTLYVSLEDLQKIVQERPDVAESGTFYGLKIILHGSTTPLYVLP